jgi:hypothetical protein
MRKSRRRKGTAGLGGKMLKGKELKLMGKLGRRRRGGRS